MAPLASMIGTAAEWLRTVRDHFGRERVRGARIADPAALQEFIASRASYVAQTSLYGYLRTRAGQRSTELFSNDAFVVSINIAKWNLWLACVGDLAIYAGGLLARRAAGRADVAPLMESILERLLAATGVPPEAGPEFAELADRVRARVAACDWRTVEDGEGPFVESPAALVRFAPIVDQLKALDEGIVRNSVRFRWQEVRRDLRRGLETDALLAHAP
ncbi:MAG: hypothetical protein KJ025_17760 [Burkholderiales bacterium]|nr:hypothetical protein [Burkholderiales bacterium]